jgi:hypothetical protein
MSKKAKVVDAARRHPLNLRTTLEMREKIEAAAKQSGRSMIQELESRIENSFNRDMVFDMLLGGSENGRLLEQLMFALRDADRDWAQEPRKAQDLIRKLEKAVHAEVKARGKG